ncbi:apoptosis-associated speck-like protein containing a CARD [Polymixia lowei]
MPPKSIKQTLRGVLRNLGKDDFKLFGEGLLDREGEPQVKKCQVEGKDQLDIVNVLVATFTDVGAVKVAIEVLQDIECNASAATLETFLQTIETVEEPAPRGPTQASSTSASGVRMDTEKHFVDKHRSELIQRVSLIDPILDKLLDRNVIDQEAYNVIKCKPTTQDKMRTLYDGPLHTCGNRGKDIFYEILDGSQKFLMDDLKGN